MKSPHSFQGSFFPSTHWSQVMIARQGDTVAEAALNQLCTKYWRPVYLFIRHRGGNPHDAEDLTQAYFSRLLERAYLRKANPDKGRFRAFLIHDLKFFLSNEMERNRALKRGGKVSFVSLDAENGVASLGAVHRPATDPEAYFDRQWALETVRLAKLEVARNFRDQGKETLFAALQSGLVTSPTADVYAVWEKDLGMSTGALKVALHRLREKLKEAIEAQILETVSSEEELQLEMRHLRRALEKTLG